MSKLHSEAQVLTKKPTACILQINNHKELALINLLEYLCLKFKGLHTVPCKHFQDERKNFQMWVVSSKLWFLFLYFYNGSKTDQVNRHRARVCVHSSNLIVTKTFVILLRP